MRKKKILYVVNDCNFFLSHRLSLAQQALLRGFEVHVAAPMSPCSNNIAKYGFIYHQIYLKRGQINPLKEVRTILSILRLYKRLKPDLLHHVTIKPVLYGSLVSSILKIPVVVNAITGMGYVFVGDGSVLKKIFRHFIIIMYKISFHSCHQKTIFQNSDDFNFFLNHDIIDKEQGVIIKGSGVDPSQYVFSPEPHGTSVVVLPSRMLWDKGVGEFVSAAVELKRRGVDARFILVGGVDLGNPASIPKEQLERWHRDGDVEWLGHRNDMLNIFFESSIVCLPSYREGLPRVLVEAAACGRAIVTTDVPGCRDIVCHEDNGLLVPAENSAALADAIQKLMENKDMRLRMGQRGRAIVKKEYSLNRIIKDTFTVYEELLN